MGKWSQALREEPVQEPQAPEPKAAGKWSQMLRKQPEQPPEQPEGFSVGEMISNIPSSAVKFGTELVQPILHPKETAEAIGNLMLGGAESLGQAVSKRVPPEVTQAMQKVNDFLSQHGFPVKSMQQAMAGKEKTVEQVGEFIKERYGSEEAFKKTVTEDPVGVLSDAAVVLSGGGTAATKLPGIAGKAGKILQTTGKAIEPINLATGATKSIIAGLTPKKLPGALMESASKFSTTIPKQTRKELAKTALEYGVIPTSKGVDKLNAIIGTYNKKIDGLISEATKKGTTIPKKALFVHLKSVRKNLGGVKAEGAIDLKHIDKITKTIDGHFKSIKADSITPTQMQEFKKDLYNRIDFDAKQLRSEIGKDMTRKAIARAAKESIEKVADVKSLNRELGKLYALRDPLERAAGRIENRDLMGIGAPIKVAAGGQAAGGAGASVAAVISALDNPKMKARLAVVLHDIEKKGQLHMIDHKLMPTLVRLGLVQAGREEEQ